MSMPNDPFLSPELMGAMKQVYGIYAAAIQSGFPEPRAFEMANGTWRDLLANALKLGK